MPTLTDIFLLDYDQSTEQAKGEYGMVLQCSAVECVCVCVCVCVFLSIGRTERSALCALREQLFAHKSDLLGAFQRYDPNNTGTPLASLWKTVQLGETSSLMVSLTSPHAILQTNMSLEPFI